MEKHALLNTYINNVTMSETIAAIEQMIETDKKSYVVAINVDVVMKIFRRNMKMGFHILWGKWDVLYIKMKLSTSCVHPERYGYNL